MDTGQALIVDMHGLAWKAFHTPAYKKLSTKTGTPSGMFYGMLVSVAKVLKRFPEAKRVLCAYDSGHSGRELLFPDYKSHRPKHSETDTTIFRSQLELATQFFEDCGFHRLTELGIEADDLIAIYAREWLSLSKKNSVVVVSIDSDFYQLIAWSKKLGLYNHRTGQFLDYKNVAGCIPVAVEQFAIYKALVGDVADNIPKCLTPRDARVFLSQEGYMTRMDKTMLRNLMLVTLPFAKMPRLRTSFSFDPRESQLDLVDAALALMEIKSMTREHFRLKMS